MDVIDAGRRVLFARCSELVQRLQTARRDLRLAHELAKLDRFDLLVLDDLMRQRMSGVAITRVTLSKLAMAAIPLPPLAEQHRIVACVEQLMKLCDALETKQRLAEEQHVRLSLGW